MKAQKVSTFFLTGAFAPFLVFQGCDSTADPSQGKGKPLIVILSPGVIPLGKYSVVPIAQATGGNPTYSFYSDTYANGVPPVGMIVDLNGNLKGTPTFPGTYTFGVCVKDLSAASACAQATATVAKVTSDTLKVTKAGAGSGKVTSDLAGLDCGSSCTGIDTNESYVNLVAVPDSGSWFIGWSGDCSGSITCILLMDSNHTVTATFGKTYSGAFSAPVTETETMMYGSCTWSATVAGTVALDLSPQSDGTVRGEVRTKGTISAPSGTPTDIRQACLSSNDPFDNYNNVTGASVSSITWSSTWDYVNAQFQGSLSGGKVSGNISLTFPGTGRATVPVTLNP